MDALIPALIGAGGIALGVELGWVLNQASSYLASERERRARFRGVLAKLLEVRHALLVQPKLTNPVDVVLKLLPPALQTPAAIVPAEARQAVQGLWAQLTPDSGAVEQRYEKAVGALAELDPVLSYKLRDKQVVLRFGTVIQEVLRLGAGTAAAVATVHQVVSEEFGAELDRAILDIGSQTESFLMLFLTALQPAAWRPGHALKQLLKRNPPSDEDVKQVFERMLTKVAERLGQPID